MIMTEQTDWPNIGIVGLYTVPMAARLVGAQQIKLRSWIDGYANSDAEPIIHRQLPRIGEKTVLGFLDLIEARFIRHFNTWFSPQTIRKVATKLRKRHDIDHPFAMNQRFRTDGKWIFMEAALDERERRILNLMNDNFEMGEIIEKSLFDTIFYIDDLARQWHPNPETPNVVIDPQFAFGHPVVEDIWIPTGTIYDAYLAEGGVAETADEFEVDEEVVRQAVKFEQELDQRPIH